MTEYKLLFAVIYFYTALYRAHSLYAYKQNTVTLRANGAAKYRMDHSFSNCRFAFARHFLLEGVDKSTMVMLWHSID